MRNNLAITRSDVEELFTETFNQHQIKHIGRILEILARYQLLSSEMLLEIYRRRHKEDLGLNFVFLAVHKKLIIELKFDLSQPTEENIFFYCLKEGGFYALDRDSVQYLRPPLLFACNEKSQILTINQFFMDRHYYPDFNPIFPVQKRSKFFYATNLKRQKIVCYFPELIKLKVLIYYFQRKLESLELNFEKIEEILGNLVFEEITAERVNFGEYTKATDRHQIEGFLEGVESVERPIAQTDRIDDEDCESQLAHDHCTRENDGFCFLPCGA